MAFAGGHAPFTLGGVCQPQPLIDPLANGSTPCDVGYDTYASIRSEWGSSASAQDRRADRRLLCRQGGALALQPVDAVGRRRVRALKLKVRKRDAAERGNLGRCVCLLRTIAGLASRLGVCVHAEMIGPHARLQPASRSIIFSSWCVVLALVASLTPSWRLSPPSLASCPEFGASSSRASSTSRPVAPEQQ